MPGRSWPRSTGSGRSASRRCSRRFGTGPRDPREAARSPAGPSAWRRRRRPTRTAAGPATADPADASPTAIVDGRAATPTRRSPGSDALGLRVVTVDDPAYPTRLARDRHAAARPVRARRSGARSSRDRAVAVVGTRRATDAGRGARRAAGARRCVAAGATVVSRASRSASTARRTRPRSDAGGTTVAVIGAGHAACIPRAHARLADAIVAAGGAVVSELAPDVAPTHGTFPRRNRVISGLADATVVVEAPARSGALDHGVLGARAGPRVLPRARARSTPRPRPAASRSCASSADGARIVAGIPQLIEDLGLADRPAEPRAHGARRRRPWPSSATRPGRVGRELVAGRRDGRRAGRGHRLAGRDGPRGPDAARAARAGGRRPRPLPPGRARSLRPIRASVEADRSPRSRAGTRATRRWPVRLPGPSRPVLP